jgi:hypothetical protein
VFGVAANRAWISPVSATLDAIPSSPPTEVITVPVAFHNTGMNQQQTPQIVSGSDSIAIDATHDQIHAKERAFEGYCFSVSGTKDNASAVSIATFPGGSATSDYRGSITIEPNVIDWDIVYGKKYLFLHACVV